MKPRREITPTLTTSQDQHGTRRIAIVVDEDASLDVVDEQGNRIAQIDLYDMGSQLNFEVRRISGEGRDLPFTVRAGGRRHTIAKAQNRAELSFKKPS